MFKKNIAQQEVEMEERDGWGEKKKKNNPKKKGAMLQNVCIISSNQTEANWLLAEKKCMFSF